MTRRRNRRRTHRNNNQAPHSPAAPEPLVPADVAINNDLVDSVIIRSSVSSICKFRSLSRWYNQHLSSEALLTEFRRLRLQPPSQGWIVTHYRSRREDRLGWIRMVSQDNNGGAIVKSHSFSREYTFAITGENPLVRLNERVNLQHVWKNLFVYSLEDGQQIVALLVFNITSVRDSIRINCDDPRFGGEYFRAGKNLESLRIIVDPNTGQRLIQLYAEVNDFIFYFEYRFGGAAWRIRQVETVQHLTMAEREHDLGMYHPNGILTFRREGEGEPIRLSFDDETYVFPPCIPGTVSAIFGCGGPLRYMFIIHYVQHPSSDQRTIHSISLQSMTDENRYQLVAKAGANVRGEVVHIRSRCVMYTVDEYVCLAITTRRHQASSYLIICYNLQLEMWMTYTSPGLVRNHEAGLSYLTRLSF